MTDITLVSWRDIPAQIIVGKGRRGAKIKLSERFEQAIDRAAMKSGADGTDAYLAEWKKTVIGATEGDPGEAAAAEAERVEKEHDEEELKRLIANGGWSAK